MMIFKSYVFLLSPKVSLWCISLNSYFIYPTQYSGWYFIVKVHECSADMKMLKYLSFCLGTCVCACVCMLGNISGKTTKTIGFFGYFLNTSRHDTIFIWELIFMPIFSRHFAIAEMSSVIFPGKNRVCVFT